MQVRKQQLELEQQQQQQQQKRIGQDLATKQENGLRQATYVFSSFRELDKLPHRIVPQN